MHLSSVQELYENVHPLFIKRPDTWRAVAKSWWVLCKNSDRTACYSFDSDWATFSAYVLENANASPEVIAKKENGFTTWGLRHLNGQPVSRGRLRLSVSIRLKG
jgi:hypothetical protein